MHKTAVTVTVVTLVLGVFGSFFRWLQLSNAFEPETGCVIPGHATSTIFLLYCVLVAVLICAVTFFFSRRFTCEKSAVILCSESVIPTVIAWVLGIIFVLVSVAMLFTAHHVKYPLLQRILGAFGILAGFCFPFLIGKSDRVGSVGQAASALVTLFYCFWLIFSYRFHSEDPVVWGYCIEILAIAFSATSFYYVAAFHFGAGRGFRALAATQLAVFFNLCTIFESRSTAALAMFAVTAVMLLLIEYLLLVSLSELRSS